MKIEEMHNSLDEVFFKILKKPSLVQKYMIPLRDHPFKTSEFFREERSKIGQIYRRILVKNCQQEGVGVQNGNLDIVGAGK